MISKAIRRAAKGQQCTVNIAQVCNYNPDTVVFAHLPDESNGMGKKSDDISGCFACSSCHSMIDRAVKPTAEYIEFKDWYQKRALIRTWRKLIELNIINIKG